MTERGYHIYLLWEDDRDVECSRFSFVLSLPVLPLGVYDNIEQGGGRSQTMREIVSEPDIQAILAARRGFLANKKESGGTFTVHDLQHLHGACRKMLGYSPRDYPNFFSETTHDFDTKWGNRGWNPCGLCRPR